MKRVLITGATGFIGRHTLLPLVERGFELHALYNREPVATDCPVTWHKADLLSEGAREKLCEDIRPTHLLHLAWYVSPTDYKTSPENDRWTHATIDLMRAFSSQGGERAVLAGTCMEYDWNTSEDALKESSPISLVTPYGHAKNNAREACEQITKEYGISFCWGRIFNVYGPFEAERRLVPQVVKALSRNETPVLTSPDTTLDYSYVTDLADAFAALVDGKIEGVINVASGVPITTLEMARTIADIMEVPDLLAKEIASHEKPERVVADVTKLREELGFRPKHSLREGLEETIAWWKKSL